MTEKSGVTKLLDLISRNGESRLNQIFNIMKDSRLNKAILLLRLADLNNPNKKEQQSCESKLLKMGVVDKDGGIINSSRNKKISEWAEKHLC